jgi:hypothetical protein
LNRLEQRKSRTGHLPDELHEQLAALPRRKKLAERLDKAFQTSYVLETEAILAVRGHIPPDPNLAKKLRDYQSSLHRLTLSLFASKFDDPSFAVVFLFKERGAPLKPLARAYLDFWKCREFKVKSYTLTVGNRETEANSDDDVLRLPYGEELEDRALWCRPSTLADSYSGQAIGAVYELRGDFALPLMHGEAGLHLFGSSNPDRILVQVHAAALRSFQPPDDLHLRRTLNGDKRRIYDQTRGVVEDLRLEMYKSWKGKDLDKLFSVMIEEELSRQARILCE